jgi:hypothetical protein
MAVLSALSLLVFPAEEGYSSADADKVRLVLAVEVVQLVRGDPVFDLEAVADQLLLALGRVGYAGTHGSDRKRWGSPRQPGRSGTRRRSSRSISFAKASIRAGASGPNQASELPM